MNVNMSYIQSVYFYTSPVINGHVAEVTGIILSATYTTVMGPDLLSAIS